MCRAFGLHIGSLRGLMSWKNVDSSMTSNYFYESVLLLLLRRNLFQHFLQQVPERLYRADKATLC